MKKKVFSDYWSLLLDYKKKRNKGFWIFIIAFYVLDFVFLVFDVIQILDSRLTIGHFITLIAILLVQVVFIFLLNYLTYVTIDYIISLLPDYNTRRIIKYLEANKHLVEDDLSDINSIDFIVKKHCEYYKLFRRPSGLYGESESNSFSGDDDHIASIILKVVVIFFALTNLILLFYNITAIIVGDINFSEVEFIFEKAARGLYYLWGNIFH